MGQTAEAEHVNIHNSAAAAGIDQIYLGLHGKLIRHQIQKAALWLPPGPFYNGLMQLSAFARSRAPEKKL